jgi:hypothetical protein
MLKKGGKNNIPRIFSFKISVFLHQKNYLKISYGENFPIRRIYSIKKKPKISQFLVQKMTKFVTGSNRVTCRVTT